MQRQAGLDELLGRGEPHATFHDGELLSIRIDHEAGELVATWRLCVGNPGAADKAERERTRQGLLTLGGLLFWCEAPPAVLESNAGSPWLTANGPLAESPTAEGQELAKRLPEGVAGWYMYFSNRNAYAYCAAKSLGFQWV